MKSYHICQSIWFSEGYYQNKNDLLYFVDF